MLRNRFCFLPQLFPGDKPRGSPFFQKSHLRLDFYPCYPRKGPHSQKSSQKHTAPVEDNCKSLNPVCPSLSRASPPIEFVEIQTTELRAVVQPEPRGYLLITAQNSKPEFTGNHVVRRLRRHLSYKEELSRQQEQTNSWATKVQSDKDCKSETTHAPNGKLRFPDSGICF